ncbi:hypothetical protein BDZ94DRAFT_390857 [Collybia nuda]|uniref:N-acetyltransferase domain-containing protein n=1 Tax=Collybia nuda TaxID=64659 RepID=A0A9P5Y8I8_9AGAR|nr:hypothetical protein BDZ94DRAFT_390857 [Collybia nuda]
MEEYWAVRLLALRTDPCAFGSNYEREVQFSNEQWKGRIGTDQIISIAARNHALRPSEGATTVEHWVPLPSKPNTEDLDIYVLVGMWVRPEHRRKGVGNKLIEAGIEAARKDNNGKARRSLMLEVYDSNETGKLLYLNNGFTICEGPGGEDGRVWMQKLIQA